MRQEIAVPLASTSLQCNFAQEISEHYSSAFLLAIPDSIRDSDLMPFLSLAFYSVILLHNLDTPKFISSCWCLELNPG